MRWRSRTSALSRFDEREGNPVRFGSGEIDYALEMGDVDPLRVGTLLERRGTDNGEGQRNTAKRKECEHGFSS